MAGDPKRKPLTKDQLMGKLRREWEERGKKPKPKPKPKNAYRR
jgi:hypothetical protein